MVLLRFQVRHHRSRLPLIAVFDDYTSWIVFSPRDEFSFDSLSRGNWASFVYFPIVDVMYHDFLPVEVPDSSGTSATPAFPKVRMSQIPCITPSSLVPNFFLFLGETSRLPLRCPLLGSTLASYSINPSREISLSLGPLIGAAPLKRVVPLFLNLIWESFYPTSDCHLSHHGALAFF